MKQTTEKKEDIKERNVNLTKLKSIGILSNILTQKDKNSG